MIDKITIFLLYLNDEKPYISMYNNFPNLNQRFMIYLFEGKKYFLIRNRKDFRIELSKTSVTLMYD